MDSRSLREKGICFFSRPYPELYNYYEMIDACVAFGIKQLEAFNFMELSSPDEEAARKLRRYADEKGVSFCCMSCFADLTGENGQAHTENMKGYTRVAAILGAPYIHHTVISEYRDPNKILPIRQQLFDEVAPRIREIYDYAQTLGILAVYEDQGFALNGVEGFRAFLEAVDRPVGVVADLGNILQAGETIEPFIRAFGPRIVHVHLKDYVLPAWEGDPEACRTVDGKQLQEVPLGDGVVDSAGAVKLLRQFGYQGLLSMEVTEPADGSLPTEQAIRRVESWLAQ